MRFIFDCDDVLLDWNGAFLTWLKGRGFNPDPAGPKNWDLSAWIRCTPDEASDLIERFNNSEHFEFIQARPGAKSAVWALHDAGHKISVLTSCGTNARVSEGRWRNLYREFARDSAGPPWTISSVRMIQLGAKGEGAGVVHWVDDIKDIMGVYA